MKYTKKLAQKVAQYQFNWTLGCMIGTDDPDYSLETNINELDQNFEEILKELEINPTPKRIEEIKLRYKKLTDRALKFLNSMYKPVFISNNANIKNKLMKKIFKKSLYTILPISFFTIWYLGCAFTEWVLDPREMTSNMRFVIVWFGILLAIAGALIAYELNKKK